MVGRPIGPPNPTIITQEEHTMTLVRYRYPVNYRTPFGGFDRSPWAGLESEIDRLFTSAWSDFGGTPGTDRFPIDLYQDNDHAYVRAELPGVRREDLTVEVVDGTLNLTVERKTKEGEQESAFRLHRAIRISDDVLADKVTAQLEHGVLTVTLPKREEAKPRKIAVNVN
jgi:HSP20 family protein